MHLVLGCLKRYAADDTCCLYALGRTRLAVAGSEAVFQYLVERVLYACQTLGRIVVLVMYMEITVAHSLARFVRQKIVVDKRFGGLARKLHHHTRRRVSVHVGVLAGDVIILGLDYLKEHVAGLGPACDVTLIAIGNISLGHLLTRALHQLELHPVLNFLYCHAFIAGHADTIGYLKDKTFVLPDFSLQHSLADSCFYLLVIISHDTAVALYYSLYHLILWLGSCLIKCVFIASAKLYKDAQLCNHQHK